LGCQEKGEKLIQLPESTTQEAEVVRVGAVRAERADITHPVRATGTSEPVRAADLGPQLTARVAAVLVEEGDVVKAGQPLVRLDVVSAELRAQQSGAQAASTRAQYEQAQREYDRLAPLVEKGTITPQQLERLTSQRDALKAAADAAEVAQADAKHTVTNALVRAPFAGVVSRVLVEVGEVATMAPVRVLVRLVDLSQVEVRVSVHERELKHIAVGSAVQARFPSTGDVGSGTVRFISPEIDPRTRTAEVVTQIENPERRLRAGMFAELAISPKERSEGLVLPTAAVAGTGTDRYVFVIEGEVARKKPIEASVIDEARIEVVQGLKEGEVVVSEGIGRLSDGSKVSVASATTEAAEAAETVKADTERAP
jgi:RND family efflux transporter MFP subunit